MGLPALSDGRPVPTRKPAFLGRGWSFPPAFSRAEGVAMAEDVGDIYQSLFILFHTERGERVMRPDFGCDLRRFLFAELDTTTLTEISETVRDAILRWEARIDPIHVSVETDPDTPGQISIGIDYRVRLTNSRGNLVFPFALGEATLGEGR